MIRWASRRASHVFTNATLFGLGLAAAFSQAFGQLPRDAQIAELLDAMSVEEKVGQMTQINITILLDREQRGVVALDADKLAEATQAYGVGSILNSPGTAVPIEVWHRLITEIQDAALATPREIPIIYGLDSIHGAGYVSDSTLFPHNIGLAATRNTELVRESARITAMETRAAGVRWNFDPVLGVGRHPLWPRFAETFGEDVYIAKTMGAAVVQGYEGDGLGRPTAVASTMKHYVGYSIPENGKDRAPAYIPDIVLWEKFLPPFQAAIDAGASSIMINSGAVNGVPVHGSRYLLNDVLREQLGFRGLIVSDWEDIIRLHTWHKVAATPREAVRQGVEAGIDMSMVPLDYSFFEHLTDLIRSGEISETRLDESVTRILELKFALGLFDDPYPEASATENFGLTRYEATAFDAARESVTLLQNEEGVLPLDKSTRVLVAGPGADNLGTLNGSWSFTWQGANENQYPADYLTILEAIVETAGEDDVSDLTFPSFDSSDHYDHAALAQAAADVDVIVLSLGERPYSESPGTIDDLSLPEEQLDLAVAAAATGKPVVLVLTQGRPRIIRELVPQMAAIVLAYRPGSQGARAIADVIYGDYNPDGVLPFSYPRFTGDLVPYDRPFSSDVQHRVPGDVTFGGYNPQWPFGHGLSYTSFAYSDLRLDSDILSSDETLGVSVTITNTGDRDGKHAVDLYVSDLFASISPSVKKLVRFDKIFVPAGESTQVTFTLFPEDISFVNSDLDRVVEPGEFSLQVGSEVASFEYR